jgi:hypothetical protein
MRFVGEQTEVPTRPAVLRAHRGVVVEQRQQHRVVAGLSGGQPDRDRGQHRLVGAVQGPSMMPLPPGDAFQDSFIGKRQCD